ncbi:hypothetical protein [Brachybacterium kimchii]|uniref:Uncharacterized protein n=1 Tax=Brachybacterium kimchii TaxID=2942909 RepID=A0ABY4N917_9MICO|nr:hypothetical protein [Brachybacterium kimchii]UQN31049.1 hypothetical protein M4486_07135 [Brachybacterium kimchii]
MSESPSQTDRHIHRRSLVKGVAWTTPAIVVSTAAPAYAASANCTPQSASQVQQSFTFTSGISKWTMSRDPSTAPAVEYSSSYNNLANAAVLVADPPANVTSTTTLQSPTACLAPGTYAFKFDSRLYNANPRNLQLRADVVLQDTGATTGNLINFTTTSGAISSRTGDTVTITITQKAQIRFRFRWTFATSGTGAGDDIGVSAPTVTKTA